MGCPKVPQKFFMLILVLGLSAKSYAGSVNDCRGVRYAYRDKGLDLRDVPRQPRQGSQLQVCTKGLTCCTEEMEKKLLTSSKDDFKKSMHTRANSIQRLFSNRANRFDEYFTDLLATSKLKFHKLFQKTYGIIYERNSDVFIDFFKDLEEYYDRGDVDLEEALKKFFSQLYQRMFVVFNAQHSFDYPYLSCVSQTMKKLQPFGDVPKKLTEQLRRSFVATRTFAQALAEGKQVTIKTLKIDPRDECVGALTKMTSCPACQGIPDIQPCSGYCLNVLKGCLAFHAEMGESWDTFIENLQTLSDRLSGPFDIEAVVDPIGVKISDAIMNFQNSGYEVTNKVFTDCGTPRIEKRQVHQQGYAYGRPTVANNGQAHGSQYNPAFSSSTSTDDQIVDEDTKLKSLIKEIKVSVEAAKGFWSKLPYEMCEGYSNSNSNNRNSNSNMNNRCWNGNDPGSYSSAIVSDGLLSQEKNPEVRVDPNRPDVHINEQIFSLKLMTKKLENAINGLPVEWHTEKDTYTYSNPSDVEGSGYECEPNSDDEDCYYDYDGYYGEGSGSGQDYTNPESSPDAADTDNKHEDEEEEDGENWPPWVTYKPDTINNDIDIEDEKKGTTKHGKKEDSTTTTSQSNPITSGGASSHVVSVVKSLLYFCLPIVACMLGGTVLVW